MALFANLATFPPLAQVTTIPPTREPVSQISRLTQSPGPVSVLLHYPAKPWLCRHPAPIFPMQTYFTTFVPNTT